MAADGEKAPNEGTINVEAHKALGMKLEDCPWDMRHPPEFLKLWEYLRAAHVAIQVYSYTDNERGVEVLLFTERGQVGYGKALRVDQALACAAREWMKKKQEKP